jgi:hypothetical protein
MEDHKDELKTILQSGGFRLKIGADADGMKVFAEAHVRHEQAGPDVLTVTAPIIRVTLGGKDIAGEGDLGLNFQTTFATGPDAGRLRCIIAGELTEIFLADIPPEDWRVFVDTLTTRNAAQGFVIPHGEPLPGRVFSFPVPGGYVRPIFGLSEAKKDLPLLMEFHEPQTPLNWAVGLAMFSLTNEDRVRAGSWQEATIRDLEDRVFNLTELDAPRRGDHRDDILAEVVKLHTVKNWYYEIDVVQVGRAWTKRATIGSQYAIPEIQLVYLDTKTGKRTFPNDPAIRALLRPLEVQGRRVRKPEGKDIPSLPKGRWQIDAIRWRWVQAFNDDLMLAPALHETGRRKGLPMKTVRGKSIRKGYLIRVADNVFTALGRLRAEGSGSKYACRLLIMLASNLNKTEDGIKADRVFRMLGIPEDYQDRAHEKPEEVIARAVLRLKERDIKALLAGSDEYPRTDPNPDRRKGPYYCFRRSPEYTPRTGIVSKETALAIEAEYQVTPEPPALSDPKDGQGALPGILKDAGPIPSGADIRAAREAAGLNLRRFAEAIKGGSFNTWARYERGESIRAGTVPPEAWDQVRDFIAQHGKKGSA